MIVCQGSEPSASAAAARVLKILEGLAELELDLQQVTVQTASAAIGAESPTNLDVLFEAAFSVAPAQPLVHLAQGLVLTDLPAADLTVADETQVVMLEVEELRE